MIWSEEIKQLKDVANDEIKEPMSLMHYFFLDSYRQALILRKKSQIENNVNNKNIILITLNINKRKTMQQLARDREREKEEKSGLELLLWLLFRIRTSSWENSINICAVFPNKIME